MILGGSPLAAAPLASMGGASHYVTALLSGKGQVQAQASLKFKTTATLKGKAIVWDSMWAKLSATTLMDAQAEERTDVTATLKATATLTASTLQDHAADAVLSSRATLTANPVVERFAKATLRAFAITRGDLNTDWKVRATLSGKGKIARANLEFETMKARLTGTAKVKANAIRFRPGDSTVASGFLQPPSMEKPTLLAA